MNLDIIKSIGGWGLAGGAWIANTSLDALPDPSKFATTGADVTMIGALIFAVVHLWKANQKLHDRVETNLQKTNDQQAQSMQGYKDSFDKLSDAVEKLVERK